jgi:hypothetical protein
MLCRDAEVGFHIFLSLKSNLNMSMRLLHAQNLLLLRRILLS